MKTTLAPLRSLLFVLFCLFPLQAGATCTEKYTRAVSDLRSGADRTLFIQGNVHEMPKELSARFNPAHSMAGPREIIANDFGIIYLLLKSARDRNDGLDALLSNLQKERPELTLDELRQELLNADAKESFCAQGFYSADFLKKQLGKAVFKIPFASSVGSGDEPGNGSGSEPGNIGAINPAAGY